MRARTLLIVQVNQICEFPLFMVFKLKLILSLVWSFIVNIFMNLVVTVQTYIKEN